MKPSEGQLGCPPTQHCGELASVLQAVRKCPSSPCTARLVFNILTEVYIPHITPPPPFFQGLVTMKILKIYFLAHNPLIITFYFIFKLKFLEKCQKCPIPPPPNRDCHVPVFFPIFVQMYLLYPPPFSIEINSNQLEGIYLQFF